jgi:hypothetical protein
MGKGLLVGLLAALALAAPASASSHSCGTWTTLTDGTRVAVQVLDGATCSFGRATAARLYSADGVPRHLTVRRKRMVLVGTQVSSTGRGYFIYAYPTGSVIVRQYSAVATTRTPAVTAPSPPVVPYTAPPPVITDPGNGYPVVCADGWLSHSGGIRGACSHHGGIS